MCNSKCMEVYHGANSSCYESILYRFTPCLAWCDVSMFLAWCDVMFLTWYDVCDVLICLPACLTCHIFKISLGFLICCFLCALLILFESERHIVLLCIKSATQINLPCLPLVQWNFLWVLSHLSAIIKLKGQLCPANLQHPQFFITLFIS